MTEEVPFQSPWNFLGLPDDLAAPERARAWIVPVPYESTTSYGAGTRNGPAAIIAASRQVELYDHEFDCEPAAEYGVHTTSPLNPVHRSPDAMVKSIEAAVAVLLSGKPRPETLVLLGGEHTISPGVARGLSKVIGRENLVAVQVDAHADLRDEYEGSPFSHACAARRILDVCPVFQIGIRNISAGEEPFRRGCTLVHTVFAEESTAPDGAFLNDLAAFVHGKHVFLTIDLDGLDPSIMPAVGTPEPGGIDWKRMLEVSQVICREAAAVPVFDVVELAPIPGFIAPDFLAAKLIYKILSYALLRDRRSKALT